jgi:hypothetical protein
MTHTLKTWPVYFDRVRDGEKQFELRKNDRDFQTGDYVTLEKWCPITKQYFGEFFEAKIGYILHAEEMGLQKGYVVFSLIAR